MIDSRVLQLGLALGLILVRDRATADSTIDEAFSCTVDALDHDGLTAHAVYYQAVANLLCDRSVLRSMHWKVIDALRAALDAIHASLDEDAAQFADEGAQIGATTAYFALIAPLGPRFQRSLNHWYNTLALPRGAKNSHLIDIAQSTFDPELRTMFLLYLAQRGVDIRGVVAGDAVLSSEQRIKLLSVQGKRLLLQASQSPQTALSKLSLDRELAKACADWTRYVTHPRVLFWHLRKQCDPMRLSEIFQQMRRWPLSPEVREQLKIELALTPQKIEAIALQTGRWRCGRCDSNHVHAIERRALDPAHEEEGAELTYACAACGLRYHSLWEQGELTGEEPAPEAWVGLV